MRSSTYLLDAIFWYCELTLHFNWYMPFVCWRVFHLWHLGHTFVPTFLHYYRTDIRMKSIREGCLSCIACMGMMPKGILHRTDSNILSTYIHLMCRIDSCMPIRTFSCVHFCKTDGCVCYPLPNVETSYKHRKSIISNVWFVSVKIIKLCSKIYRVWILVYPRFVLFW